jgi:hypothetical protein
VDETHVRHFLGNSLRGQHNEQAGVAEPVESMEPFQAWKLLELIEPSLSPANPAHTAATGGRLKEWQEADDKSGLGIAY